MVKTDFPPLELIFDFENLYIYIFVQYGPGGQQTGTLQGFGDISNNGCIPILNTGGGMTTNAPATGGITMTADAEL